jgi:hypothetical protein
MKQPEIHLQKLLKELETVEIALTDLSLVSVEMATKSAREYLLLRRRTLTYEVQNLRRGGVKTREETRQEMREGAREKRKEAEDAKERVREDAKERVREERESGDER